MSLYQRPKSVRAVGLLTCLGSLAGLVTSLSGILSDQSGGAGLLFLSIALAYFLAGMIIGGNLIFEQVQYRKRCVWFWWIQVPVLNSSYFSFHAATGAFCALWLRFDVYDAGFAFGIGSQFQIELMAGGPMAVGVNIFALTIVLLIRGLINAEMRRK